jgi:signal transduction histidine kinase
MMKRWAESRDYREWEWELTAKDGSTKTVAWSNISKAFPVPGWATWGVGIDVTARKRAEGEREQMQATLLQTQKLESLGILAGGIAHDFNNLLTGIMGNASLALEAVPPGPARESLEDVVGSSERAAMLTHQLLAYAGKAALKTRATNLSEQVREIVGLLSTALPPKVSLTFDLAEILPVTQTDPGQLQQLVMNLVMNAAEACAGERGLVSITTGVEVVDAGDMETFLAGHEMSPGTHVYLQVDDFGVGMDEETRTRIFDPFFSTKFTGRGLGLAAVLGIVRSHRGAILVDSAPGRGSTFKVLLPAVSGEVASDPSETDEDLSGSGLVLVVDDDPMVRRFAGKALQALGYRVLEAESGQRATEIFGDLGQAISCVLLDLTMPDMDGVETLHALQSLQPDVRVILSSGYKDVASRAQLGRGDLPFIAKPYTFRALGRGLKEVLGPQRIPSS